MHKGLDFSQPKRKPTDTLFNHFNALNTPCINYTELVYLALSLNWSEIEICKQKIVNSNTANCRHNHVEININ